MCENDLLMQEKLKKRFIDEKKKHEDKLVTQRLQSKIQMRSLFSSRNLCALSTPKLALMTSDSSVSMVSNIDEN